MFIKKNWENLLQCKNIKILEFKCFYMSILKLYFVFAVLCILFLWENFRHTKEQCKPRLQLTHNL